MLFTNSKEYVTIARTQRSNSNGSLDTIPIFDITLNFRRSIQPLRQQNACHLLPGAGCSNTAFPKHS